MSILDRAALLAGYLCLPYALAVALGTIAYRLTDQPLWLAAGVALGLGWAIVGLHEWAWEVSRWNS